MAGFAMKMNKANLGQWDEDQELWRTANELLEARQYEAVAELFHRAQLTGAWSGDTISSDILTAAHSLSLVLVTYQAEVTSSPLKSGQVAKVSQSSST